MTDSDTAALAESVTAPHTQQSAARSGTSLRSLRGGATLDYPVYLASPLDDHLGNGKKILNTTIARPWSNQGRVFCVLQALQRVRPCPYTPQQLPAACAPFYGPQAAIFAPMSSRAAEMSKRKTAVKAICRPVTAFYALVAIPIFPHRKTAYSDPQTAPQGIN